MTKVLDGQGYTKTYPDVIYRGYIVAFYGTQTPTGWALCDGANGTPDLRGRVLIGDTAVGTGTAGGTEQANTGLTHSGFALGNHSNHSPTQPAAHSAHSPTQPAGHTAHVPVQPGVHDTHSSQGAHTHDNHTTAATGSAAVAGAKLTGPATHSSVGAHAHDAHPAHTGFALSGAGAHAHAAFDVDAHSAHSAFAVDAHSAHSMTQADTHLYKVRTLCFLMKL